MYRMFASKERAPTRGADGVDIVVVEDEPVPGQRVDVRCCRAAPLDPEIPPPRPELPRAALGNLPQGRGRSGEGLETSGEVPTCLGNNCGSRGSMYNFFNVVLKKVHIK